MARRKKSSPLEDWIGLISMLPWWAGCALALVFYLLLHRMAAPPVLTGLPPGQVVGAMVQSVGTGLANIGQYVLPLLCLIGAAISAYRRRQRQNLVANVAGSKAADSLDDMSWQEFELLVGEAFRLQGFQVTEMGGGGADGGVDLVLRKGSEKFLVQCKQWKAFTVGVTVVRELYGVMAAEGAAGGFVVTSGRFTEDATAFASGRNVKLIDGPRLFGLIKQASAARVLKANAPAMHNTPAYTKTAAVPLCPICTKSMVQRTAKRGSSAGSAFWGCSGYPSCRGTKQIG